MASWIIDFTGKAEKELDKPDAVTQERILHYLHERVAINPRQYGDALTGDKKGLWRYRVGDYRIITQIKEKEVLVLVVRVGHRKEVYDF